MDKVKEQIKQRIAKKRGEYKRARKKKFQYLKHTGQMANYYKRRIIMKIPLMPRLKPIVTKKTGEVPRCHQRYLKQVKPPIMLSSVK
jgi:hypothetical protein